MEKGSIRDHLHRGEPFSSLACLEILVQASLALEYLHSLREEIVHRDVKPDNMLVVHRRPGGEILLKFADFGTSHREDDPMTFCGSAPYLAPEINSLRDFERQLRPGYTASVDI